MAAPAARLGLRDLGQVLELGTSARRSSPVPAGTCCPAPALGWTQTAGAGVPLVGSWRDPGQRRAWQEQPGPRGPSFWGRSAGAAGTRGWWWDREDTV